MKILENVAIITKFVVYTAGDGPVQNGRKPYKKFRIWSPVKYCIKPQTTQSWIYIYYTYSLMYVKLGFFTLGNLGEMHVTIFYFP